MSQFAFTISITIILYGKIPNSLKNYDHGCTLEAPLLRLWEVCLTVRKDSTSALPWKTFILLIKVYI